MLFFSAFSIYTVSVLRKETTTEEQNLLIYSIGLSRFEKKKVSVAFKCL